MMSRSWNNSNSNNSSGFVYFSVNNSYQKNQSDTSDFLSFGDSPSYGSPKLNRFSPNHYSSPQNFHKSPRQYNNNNRNNYRNYSDGHRYSGGHQNRPYNKANNSYNSSYNNNTRRRESGPHNRTKMNNSGKADMSIYFDHTSLKDPWAELEANLKKKREAETMEIVDVVDSKEETPAQDNAESSSESGSEQETESESKSSTSGMDEETT